MNQAIYQRMAQDGCSLAIGVPARWRNEFHGGWLAPVPLEGLERALFTLPVLFPGRPQRHLYLVNPRSTLKAYRPSTLFIEAEAFSFSALQWGAAARSLQIPFGVQAAENLDRPLPAPVIAYRRWLLSHASFVAARSTAAGERVHEWGARGDVVLLPHAVPLWNVSRTPSAVFTIGYAGRLVPEKGISDLVDAFLRMNVPAQLVLFGDGPLRPGVERGSSKIKVVADFTHERMAEAYAEIDLLVLPSRSTPTWEEQFGRVLVEALSCGVPVLGSDSGEIPWVIRTTGGGEVFPEGDVGALASLLDDLARDADRRARLAQRGREAVRRLFSLEVVARNMRTVIDAAARR
jgi:glycosyltransferase involved in cell wall biosynthesis